MADTAKYEAYRVLQPFLKAKTPSLFRPPDMDEQESRIGSLKRAIEIGILSERQWAAGSPVEIDDGIAFQVGHKEVFKSYSHEDGRFKAKDDQRYLITDVFIDYPTQVMLIRRGADTPSAFLVSQIFKEWLRLANDERHTNFDTIVQAIPMVEDFLAALRQAQIISRLSFVVHGPNPADESEIVGSITRFTQEHGIQTTTVSLTSANIDPETAQEIAVAAGKMGDSVSATISDSKTAIPRHIRMKRKPRSMTGPKDPSPKEGRRLLDQLKSIIKSLGVGTNDGGKPKKD